MYDFVRVRELNIDDHLDKEEELEFMTDYGDGGISTWINREDAKEIISHLSKIFKIEIGEVRFMNRYKLTTSGVCDCMIPNPEGSWVKYEDAHKEILRQQANATVDADEVQEVIRLAKIEGMLSAQKICVQCFDLSDGDIEELESRIKTKMEEL